MMATSVIFCPVRLKGNRLKGPLVGHDHQGDRAVCDQFAVLIGNLRGDARGLAADMEQLGAGGQGVAVFQVQCLDIIPEVNGHDIGDKASTSRISTRGNECNLKRYN